MATENKNLSEFDKTALPKKDKIAKQRFAIITSLWNENVTKKLEQGAYDTLKECGATDIEKYYVPGSFELINAAGQLIKNKYDAIIVIGCVIQGETRHFDFVCQGVTQGIAQLNAMQKTPIIFCVLTDNNIEQSLERSGGKHGNKGVEAAISAIHMANLGHYKA